MDWTMAFTSSFLTRANSVASIRSEFFASGAYFSLARRRIPSGSPVAEKLEPHWLALATCDGLEKTYDRDSDRVQSSGTGHQDRLSTMMA